MELITNIGIVVALVGGVIVIVEKVVEFLDLIKKMPFVDFSVDR